MSAGEKESSGCGEDNGVDQQEGHAFIPKNVSLSHISLIPFHSAWSISVFFYIFFQ